MDIVMLIEFIFGTICVAGETLRHSARRARALELGAKSSRSPRLALDKMLEEALWQRKLVLQNLFLNKKPEQSIFPP